MSADIHTRKRHLHCKRYGSAKSGEPIYPPVLPAVALEVSDQSGHEPSGTLPGQQPDEMAPGKGMGFLVWQYLFR